MAKLSNNAEVAQIHKLLDDPPTGQEIEQALSSELVTAQDVIRFLVSCMAQYDVYMGHGADNYWTEATEIVQAVMHLTPPCDESTLTSRLTREERLLIAKIIRLRIIDRIPTPYLTHRAFFCSHQFYIDSRVIVPRSPIGELIDEGFSPYLDRNPDRVLDMCTGSGCIAIAIALQFDGDTQVDAVDVSSEALEVCQINIEAYGLEDIVTPIQSDLFDNLPAGDKYDLIVANPPYVNQRDLDNMPQEFGFEPDESLGSGQDGLNCAKRILAKAADYLDEDGILVMEVGNSEENLLEAFPMVPFHFVDLKKGGSGVFVLSYEQLRAYHDLFSKQVMELDDASK